MKIFALDIPDQPEALAPWLEQQVMGENLSSLVAELSAAHGPPASPASLNDVLGGQLSPVLDEGLGRLSPGQIEALLTQPRLLLDLQEHVFIGGGPHWDSTAQFSPQHQAAVQRGREQLEDLFSEELISSSVSPAPAQRAVSTHRGGHPRRLHPAIVSLTTAALVLIGVFVWQNWMPSKPVAQGWGWSRPGLLDSSLSREQYFQALIRGAEEFDNKPTPTKAALANRILQFRQGCSTLILAEHKPLTPDDRQWLADKCRLWAKKLDGHLEKLEEEKSDLSVVQKDVQNTIDALIKAMQDRIA